MPRSGTTWVGKIFDSDPNTLYMHEPDSWKRMDFLPLFTDTKSNRTLKNQVKDYHAALEKISIPQVTTKLPVFRKNYQTIGRFYQYKASVYIVNILRKLGYGLRLEPAARIGKGDSSYVLVWKSIESLGRLSCLCSSIDNSFGIHIVRNPAGYIASVLNGEQKSNFREITPTSEDYQLFEMLLATGPGNALGISIDDLKLMDPVERLAIRWRLYNEMAYTNCKNSENYYLVRYEDVCRDPLGIAKKLFAFCGIEMTPQTEDFISLSTTRQNDAYYAVYKSPLKAAYSWKNRLTDTDVDKIKHVLKSSLAFSWYQDDFSSS